jgi:4-hydroxy-4-methyl-2-oxoglutarate aldolase
VQPGDVIVLSMPQPRPVALVGDLLATQAQVAGAAAILIDASVRDTEELAQMGLPIWSRYVRVKGALKGTAGELNVPVTVGGALINPGDVLVLDSDGVAVVPQDRVEDVLQASLAREEKERTKREKLQSGLHSYDLDGLRAVVEAQR